MNLNPAAGIHHEAHEEHEERNLQRFIAASIAHPLGELIA